MGNLKKLIMMFIIATLLSSVMVYASCAEEQEIKIKINGKQIDTDVKPFIDENSRTLVPVRVIAENLNARVTWNQDYQEVMVCKRNRILKMQIGKDEMKVNFFDIEKMDTTATIKDNRTFIPLRSIVENLNCEVSWNGEERTIEITERPEQIHSLPITIDGITVEKLEKKNGIIELTQDSNEYFLNIYYGGIMESPVLNVTENSYCREVDGKYIYLYSVDDKFFENHIITIGVLGEEAFDIENPFEK